MTYMQNIWKTILISTTVYIRFLSFAIYQINIRLIKIKYKSNINMIYLVVETKVKKVLYVGLHQYQHLRI